jgi:hypothetical protein
MFVAAFKCTEVQITKSCFVTLKVNYGSFDNLICKDECIKSRIDYIICDLKLLLILDTPTKYFCKNNCSPSHRHVI